MITQRQAIIGNLNGYEAFLEKYHDEVVTSSLRVTKIPLLCSHVPHKIHPHRHLLQTLHCYDLPSYAHNPTAQVVHKYCTHQYKSDFLLRLSRILEVLL